MASVGRYAINGRVRRRNFEVKDVNVIVFCKFFVCEFDKRVKTVELFEYGWYVGRFN